MNFKPLSALLRGEIEAKIDSQGLGYLKFVPGSLKLKCGAQKSVNTKWIHHQDARWPPLFPLCKQSMEINKTQTAPQISLALSEEKQEDIFYSEKIPMFSPNLAFGVSRLSKFGFFNFRN